MTVGALMSLFQRHAATNPDFLKQEVEVVLANPTISARATTPVSAVIDGSGWERGRTLLQTQMNLLSLPETCAPTDAFEDVRVVDFQRTLDNATHLILQHDGTLRQKHLRLTFEHGDRLRLIHFNPAPELKKKRPS